ncbi:unnamed protein product [Heligmosomoides polygyrus]|uniref:Uncharacterized protein n=1 Tax=Heligmosomoides polygyrus TaxID=6339 RepID=A0A183GHZ4_HELPZ|nr:unnamed protein product [Heligmosomoides polygyrus]
MARFKRQPQVNIHSAIQNDGRARSRSPAPFTDSRAFAIAQGTQRNEDEGRVHYPLNLRGIESGCDVNTYSSKKYYNVDSRKH